MLAMIPTFPEKSLWAIFPINSTVSAFKKQRNINKGYKELKHRSDKAVRLIEPMFQINGCPTIRGIHG